MTTSDGRLPLAVKKLAAFALMIVGFLVLASGYRYGSVLSAVAGVLLLAVGITMLALKIARRNRDGTA